MVPKVWGCLGDSRLSNLGLGWPKGRLQRKTIRILQLLPILLGKKKFDNGCASLFEV